MTTYRETENSLPKPVTEHVIDFLADLDSLPLSGKERARAHRVKKQASKRFTTCQHIFCGCGCLCGKPLLSKWGTLRGTDDEAKAVCAECTTICLKYRAKATTSRCTHPNLRQYAFTDGDATKMCPDCTWFDRKRKKVLKHGKTPRRTLVWWVYGERHTVSAESVMDSLSDVAVVGQSSYGGVPIARFHYPTIWDKQASLMYRGHEHLPHTIGSCFMLLGDEVSVNGQLQRKLVVNDIPVAPPVQRTSFVNRTFSRTCISNSPFLWSQQTGWYQKRVGIVT